MKRLNKYNFCVNSTTKSIESSSVNRTIFLPQVPNKILLTTKYDFVICILTTTFYYMLRRYFAHVNINKSLKSSYIIT